MVDLADLAVGELMHNLRLRYKASPMEYYTYVGDVLVVINPLEDKGLISPQHVEMYKGSRLAHDPPLSPHIFAVGAEAYARMLDSATNQSIVVSGESGAGKSESTKHVLHYLAAVATASASSSSLSSPSINDKILATSEVLEAFGNAKTSRNDNSSRFGKFVQIQFSTSGAIVGAAIEQYLLEKSRIVAQEPGERNYHIFYMIFAALPPPRLAALGLTTVTDYRYLIGPDGANAASYGFDKAGEPLDDAGRYESFLAHLATLGFGDNFVDAMLGVIAADDTARVTVVDPAPLVKAAELLGIPGGPDALELALTTVRIGDNVAKNLTPVQASDTTDALAKAVYGLFFEGLVEKHINGVLAGAGAATWIGVLDIFGFESFQESLPDGSVETANKFEQLCINLTNEVLQHYFFESLIPAQAAKYAVEGVTVDSVVYRDNAGCIDLIMGPKASLLSLLDSVTKMASVSRDMQANPRAADAKWLADIVRKYGKRKTGPLAPADWKRDKADFFGWHLKPDMRHHKHETDFFIHHYAGLVWYTSIGAVQKNMDALSQDCSDLLATSTSPLVAGLAAHASTRDSDAAAQSSRARASRRTVASKFSASLRSLSSALASTQALFVRCVKPNCVMRKGGFFEDWKVLDQLVSAGMYAIIEMRLAGFPLKAAAASPSPSSIDETLSLLLNHLIAAALDLDVLDRIAPLPPPEADDVSDDPAQARPRTRLLDPSEMYAIGHSKILLKDKLWQALNTVRTAALRALAERKRVAAAHLRALADTYRALARLPDLRAAAAALARRNERKRALIAAGASPDEAEAQLAAEEAAAAARKEAAFRARVFDPLAADAARYASATASELALLDDFVASALHDAEKTMLRKAKAALRPARAAATAAIDTFSADVHDEAKAALAAASLAAWSSALENVTHALDQARAQRARAIALAEEQRLAAIQALKDAKRQEQIAAARAAMAAQQREIEEKLAVREQERHRRAAESAQLKRKALAEARKLRAERQAFQMHLRRERMLLEEQEARARARRDRRAAKAAKVLAARTKALADLPVKFEDTLAAVKYVGSLPFPGAGEFVGIAGPRHYGEVGTNGFCMGIQFFACAPGHGVFVRPDLLHIIKSPHAFRRGDRVWRLHTHTMGVVRYVGATQFAAGTWVGIEVDAVGTGKNDGSLDGVRYFDAPPATGLFLRPSQLGLAIPWSTEFVDAATDAWCTMNGIWIDADGEDLDEEDDEELFARLRELQDREKAIAGQVAAMDIDLAEDELGVLKARVEDVERVRELVAGGMVHLDPPAASPSP
ncbi:uncharacterized protein AMSG_12322 [Thecamonas trahens ATCC 50062]|uniref:Uncharacterized protein n=1 Tax=Thecamonas trahens ATCC 50062 TaxID=461836 RepID=A0A0L0DSE7_THETB|nr:hypothetical protein AMSG_12322 [Thecamonas trahens ATCC 50062]KNC54383.1 hypothetical protein AMSG_12322 [Thecamonas trahens ATCC 50062]|eukprot:XP_013753739.1 hypothetical protein AMSG_12322 [Thecamonas trahens ATCC 50062]